MATVTRSIRVRRGSSWTKWLAGRSGNQPKVGHSGTTREGRTRNPGTRTPDGLVQSPKTLLKTGVHGFRARDYVTPQNDNRRTCPQPLSGNADSGMELADFLIDWFATMRSP